MSAVLCPACQKALPESVLKGPAQAVVRCEGCATLLLWSHGRVVRSARSNQSTLQGIAAQKPPLPKPPPAKPATTKTLMGIPTPPAPAEAKTHIAAAVAPPPKAKPGPKENPSSWFDSPDDDPTQVGSEPVPELLPPLEPEPTTKPPLPKTIKAEAPKPPKPELPKTIQAEAPKIEPKKPKVETPAARPEQKPKELPKTVQAEAPRTAPQKIEPKIEPQKIEPKIERQDPSPLPLPPPIAVPPFRPTPTPPGGAMEPALGLSPDKRRSPLMYGAAAMGTALILSLVAFFAFRGGKPETLVEKPAAPAPKPVAPAPEPPKPPPEPARPEPVAAEATKPAEPPPKPAEAVAPPPEPPKAEPPKPEPPKREAARPTRPAPIAVARNEEEPRRSRHEERHARTLGGKKVVVEDDSKSAAPAPVQEDPGQVDRAREAYRKGNEKLFAGNSVEAIAAYKQSLTIYPGYVAGYRGLGLAYAQEGNTAEALKALRTYVKNAPNAHDVPLILKRIERLEKNPQD
jgi:hypothetical protein